MLRQIWVTVQLVAPVLFSKSFPFGRTSVLKDPELSMGCSCQQLGRGRIMFYALQVLCSSGSSVMLGHVVPAERQSIVFVSLVDDVPLMRGWHVMFKMVLQHTICKWWMQWYAFLPFPSLSICETIQWRVTKRHGNQLYTSTIDKITHLL